MDNIERELPITGTCNFLFYLTTKYISDLIFEFSRLLAMFLSLWVLLWLLVVSHKKNFQNKIMLESNLILNTRQWDKAKKLHVQLLPWRVVKSTHKSLSNGTYLGSCYALVKQTLPTCASTFHLCLQHWFFLCF